MLCACRLMQAMQCWTMILPAVWEWCAWAVCERDEMGERWGRWRWGR
ncbi:hypothetical protein M758_11G044300 [Ceratodon purpureus]|nr:hypothetical protein M758_11G044300 [Ceratodon purpureus]